MDEQLQLHGTELSYEEEASEVHTIKATFGD